MSACILGIAGDSRCRDDCIVDAVGGNKSDHNTRNDLVVIKDCYIGQLIFKIMRAVND